MIKHTMIIAVLLILLGIGGYVLTGSQSITALIPAFFGVLIIVLILGTQNNKYHKHAMHVVMVLAVLGLLGSVSGVAKLFILLSGGEVLRPAAAVSQSAMAVLCIILLAFGIKSFIVVRRK